jgi:hypothetical protein
MRSHTRLSVIPIAPDILASLAIDLKIARQRMRHLELWNITPLPMKMHSVLAKSEKQLTPEERARCEQIALQLLAVHMWEASAKSALL